MGNAVKVTNAKGYSKNFATRGQRRAAVQCILADLKEIILSETNYRDNIPDNLAGSVSYDVADFCIANLEEAFDALESAY